MTVRGAIDPAKMGRTLEHEHILVDFIGAEATGYHRWDRNRVERRVLPHLRRLKQLGFDSLVECTPAFVGRDPRLLQSLSEKSGLHLLTNTGFYGARQNRFIPERMKGNSAEEFAELWVQEFRDGIEGTGIKPGFLKIGIDAGPALSPLHETLLRAACRAHLQTGLTIACHTGPSPIIFSMLEVLEQEGVSPDALIWVHATLDRPENQVKAARIGLWVSIDHVRVDPERINIVVASLKRLKSENLLHRVLLSHDAGWYRPDDLNGGLFRPYTAISEVLLPRLKEEGFTEQDLKQLLATNPQRAFTIALRQLPREP